jgi:protein AbiQ
MRFYTVDNNYVKQLHTIDSEVFYEPVNYDTKPYIGIIIQNGNYPYFIPLSSAKPKHIKWANVTKTNYLIYEMLPRDFTPIPTNWIYSTNQNGIKHLLAVLEIKKMIPVPSQYYTPINFLQISDTDYRALLQKEYKFLKPLENSIEKKANELYTRQKQTGIIIPFACDYAKLEKVYLDNVKTTITV